MARRPRSVDEVLARFDEYSARLDGHTPAASRARRRAYSQTVRGVGRRVAGAAAALALLVIATVVFSQMVGPIGIGGFTIVLIAAALIAGFLLLRPSGEPRRVAYSEELPTPKVVRQLESLLVGERAALPAPAARQADAITERLPLLEQRLAEVDPLDPLAQDARRLMGKHLPELIERYERIPAPYRRERDGEGMTVDERLASSLGAARQALDEIGSKLARHDRDAFETQGRFIETRYKDPSDLQGS